jgi:hypothetical protein
MDAASSSTRIMPSAGGRQRPSPPRGDSANEAAAMLDRCRQACREVEAARLFLAELARLRGPMA